MLVFHSKVYISLFFCVLEQCFWYSLCVDCLQALCCQRGLSEGTKVTRRHWTYAKWKQSSYSSQSCGIKSSEQHPSDANVMLCFQCSWFTHLSVTGGRSRKRKKKLEEKRKWVIKSENHVSSQQEVPHNEMLRVPYCLC